MKAINIRIPTEINIHKNDVLQLVFDWLDNTELYTIPGLKWDGSFTGTHKHKDKSLSYDYCQEKDLLAIHYEILLYREKRKESVEIVFNETKHHLFFRYLLSDKKQVNYFRSPNKMPYILRLMVMNGFFSSECDIPVTTEPTYITRKYNYRLAEKASQGVLQHYLPVVYLTKTLDYDYPTHPGKLASFLAGRAVVLAEDDPLVRDRIAVMEDSPLRRGYVTIYYPHMDSVKTVINNRNFSEGLELAVEVTKYVNQYWEQKQFNDDQTWHGVTKQILDAQKAMLEKSRNQIAAENEQLYKELDSEITGKEMTVESLKEKIDALTAKLRSVEAERDGLQAKLNSRDNVPVIYAGSEKALYEGEIRDIVLDALSEQRNECPENSRKADVLGDILESNHYDEALKKKRTAVKRTLNGDETNTKNIMKQLDEVGIESEYAGKHIRLYYHGDRRYTCTMALTPSDHRSAKNLASLINKTML